MKISSYCDQIHPHAVGDKGSHPQGWSFGGNIHYVTGKVGVAGRRALPRRKPGGFGRVSAEKNWSKQGKSFNESLLWFKVVFRETFLTQGFNNWEKQGEFRCRDKGNNSNYFPFTPLPMDAEPDFSSRVCRAAQQSQLLLKHKIQINFEFFPAKLGLELHTNPILWGHTSSTLIFGRKPIRPRFCSRFRGSLTFTPRCFM